MSKARQLAATCAALALGARAPILAGIKPVPDFVITNNGSVIGFEPKTDGAKEWFQENVSFEPWQQMGATIWVDHRVAQHLINALEAEAFELEDA